VDVESSGQRPTDSAGGGKRRVLVVDDEQFMVHTLAKILELMGYEPVSAYGGREAFRIFLSQPVDLVITDLHMPDMSGLELLTSMKAHNPAVPVILITGYGVDSAREAASKWRADGFIGKPFKVQELQALIERTFSGGHNGAVSGPQADPVAVPSKGVA
jgi:DNA-binding NtrC family response regulator